MARWGDRWAREFESDEDVWREYEDFEYDALEDFFDEDEEQDEGTVISNDKDRELVIAR